LIRFLNLLWYLHVMLSTTFVRVMADYYSQLWKRGLEKMCRHNIDPEWVNISKEAAKIKGMEDKVAFMEADVTEVDLSEASVILCYLNPTASAALRSKFEIELKPGTRAAMELFPVPIRA
jgi:ribosomal protein L18E